MMGGNPFNPRDRIDGGIWGPDPALWGSTQRVRPEKQQTNREIIFGLLLDLLKRMEKPFKGKERE